MNWMTTVLISAAILSLSNIIAKIYQSKIPQGVGMMVFSLGVLIVSVVISITSNIPVSWSKSVQQASLLAFLYGVIWAFGQFFFLLTLSKNAPLSLAIPVLVGGIAVGGVTSGLIFFGETLSLMRVIGIVTVLAGTIILSR